MTAAEKNIYAFVHAGVQRHVDPSRLVRQLWAVSEGEYGKWLDQWASKDLREQDAGILRLVPLACEVFGLGEPLDPATGQGVLEDTALEVLEGFLRWLDAKKKNTDNSPPV